MKHTIAIIDPGSKLKSAHLTVAEKYGPKLCPNNFLLCCKAFNLEGTILLWTTNTFVFTQASALENFWKLPLRQRLLLERVTLRVVGRYYDDAGGINEFSRYYHENFKTLQLPIIERCPALWGPAHGLQSYCWRQITDFLENLCRTKFKPTRSAATGQVTNGGTKAVLLPSLKAMRMDLVSRQFNPLNLGNF